MSDVVEMLRAYPAVEHGDALSVDTVCALMEDAAAEILSLRAQLASMGATGAALVSALDAAMPHIDGAIQIATIHHCAYGGPQFGTELEAMRAALGDQTNLQKMQIAPEAVAAERERCARVVEQDDSLPFGVMLSLAAAIRKGG